MTFSQKLKYILSEQNISQAELSRLTGINKSIYQAKTYHPRRDRA